MKGCSLREKKNADFFWDKGNRFDFCLQTAYVWSLKELSFEIIKVYEHLEYDFK